MVTKIKKNLNHIYHNQYLVILLLVYEALTIFD